MPRIRRACRFRRSSSAGAGATTTMPLVLESADWTHGVFMGATMGSETTAAAAGKVGVVRRDPMAMLPFCGYNIGDYLGHWLAMRAADHPSAPPLHGQLVPQGRRRAIFSGPAMAKICACSKWILDRIDGRAQGHQTPVGIVPAAADLDLTGLEIAPRNCIRRSRSTRTNGKPRWSRRVNSCARSDPRCRPACSKRIARSPRAWGRSRRGPARSSVKEWLLAPRVRCSLLYCAFPGLGSPIVGQTELAVQHVHERGLEHPGQ